MSRQTLGEQLYTEELFTRTMHWQTVLEDRCLTGKQVSLLEQHAILALIRTLHEALDRVARQETRLERQLYGHPPTGDPEQAEGALYIARGLEAMALMLQDGHGVPRLIVVERDD